MLHFLNFCPKCRNQWQIFDNRHLQVKGTQVCSNRLPHLSPKWRLQLWKILSRNNFSTQFQSNLAKCKEDSCLFKWRSMHLRSWGFLKIFFFKITLQISIKTKHKSCICGECLNEMQRYAPLQGEITRIFFWAMMLYFCSNCFPQNC